MSSKEEMKQHYHALVDMGSNGIRFSITDLLPPTSRILPTVYQDRSPISLYDAQSQNGTKIPIPEPIIQDVITALLRFKRTCTEFLVPDTQVRIVATEATRNAINGPDLIRRIDEQLGWKSQLLSKEDEGRLGAMGVASSVDELEGIVMDMGGGSVQMTWVSKQADGEIEMGEKGSISLPFGAAALFASMGTSSGNPEESPLSKEIVQKFQDGLSDLGISNEKPLNLYLSGGGFRGWGHLLMALDEVQPYPIPIVNGYSIHSSRFLPEDIDASDLRKYRISKRRASQVPGVELVVKALLRAISPKIKLGIVTFCQGGVREGLLYNDLPRELRRQKPLVAATKPFAPHSASELLDMVSSLVPAGAPLDRNVVEATVNLLYAHASNPKDIRSSAALRSTTTGLLSATHGLSHYHRCILGLVLCERWGGKVAPIDEGFLQSLQRLISPLPCWWAKYLGRVASGIADLYPAGLVDQDDIRPFSIERCSLVTGGSEQEESSKSIEIDMVILEAESSQKARDWTEGLTKLGKKKNWADGERGIVIDLRVSSS
ncbi:MAG: hypothetical protein OHK93_001072 [Ramalina farinacea]|uniref:Ppx/GppA phosphatase domain-containing protein n=1 Tax=Ramalina farinacea TaxID=258253 RepID=A0AA43TVU4_9LECA|nr:hypothetical protein [Ramalina farinacea]